jgi:hypothetical protein
LICACFIYFGVATIGLLLGSILAGSLDDASKKDHHDALIKDCPNCLRLEMQKKRNSTNQTIKTNHYFNSNSAEYGEGNSNQPFNGPNCSSGDEDEEEAVGLDISEVTSAAHKSNRPTRQSHTKHMSLALDATQASEFFKGVQHARRMSADFQTINENSPFLDRSSSSYIREPTEVQANVYESPSTASSEESSSNLTKPMSRLKAVKYIVLTLNRALLNSLLIIFIGSAGKFSL